MESHYVPGGAAHTFRARAKGIEGDFCFDSGPSLYGGLSGERTSSPLKHVYQILGEEPKWIQYDRPGLCKKSTSSYKRYVLQYLDFRPYFAEASDRAIVYPGGTPSSLRVKQMQPLVMRSS